MLLGISSLKGTAIYVHPQYAYISKMRLLWRRMAEPPIPTHPPTQSPGLGIRSFAPVAVLKRVTGANLQKRKRAKSERAICSF